MKEPTSLDKKENKIRWKQPKLASRQSLTRKPRLNKKTDWLLWSLKWLKHYKNQRKKLKKWQKKKPQKKRNRRKSRRFKLLLSKVLPSQNNLLQMIPNKPPTKNKQSPQLMWLIMLRKSRKWWDSLVSSKRKSKINKEDSIWRKRWSFRRPKSKLGCSQRRIFLNLRQKKTRKSENLFISKRSIYPSPKDTNKNLKERKKMNWSLSINKWLRSKMRCLKASKTRSDPKVFISPTQNWSKIFIVSNKSNSSERFSPQKWTSYFSFKNYFVFKRTF